MCKAVPDDARRVSIFTWADNGACPAFKRRADAAERAAKRIWGACWGGTPEDKQKSIATIIREEIAKDKEAK